MLGALSRRQLIRGQINKRHTFVRPPWTISETRLLDNCTCCDRCIDVCETNILIRGQGGYPEVDFAKGECTFCQACASSCEHAVFDLSQVQPWPLKAVVGQNCLAQNNIECRSCVDHCEPRAITFSPQLKQASTPSINSQECTGCGACVSPCPVAAITVLPEDIQSGDLN